ncbi:hypothetical protein BHE74_00004558 [Ensete ventricosum]|nr:hypothetical protein BHE74_00004558 [Ensete ventricosum]
MSVVDSFFLLGAEARGRFLQIAGCTLGCTYICTWTPLHHPPVKYVIFHSCCDLFLRGKQLVISFSTSVLISTDGWHREKDSDLPSSSSGSISLRLFEAYRGSFCSIRSGYVFPKKDKINHLSVPSRIPGLAYNGAPAYIELRDADLMNMAWMNVQREFYQVIKFSYYFMN